MYDLGKPYAEPAFSVTWLPKKRPEYDA